MSTETHDTPTGPQPIPDHPTLALEIRPHWKDDCHRLLLALAGRLPDAALTRLRTLLASDDRRAFSADLGHTVVAEALALPEPDEDLVAELLEGEGLDSSLLDTLLPFAAETALRPAFVFTPQPDGTPPHGDGLHDAFDQAAVAAVSDLPGIHGLWRSWRWSTDLDDAPPRRIYLVEADRTHDLPALTARLQQLLASQGEPHPQVEAHASGEALPRYQQLARSHGALLWMPTKRRPLRLAPALGEPDTSEGPHPAPDHPRMADPGEVALVAAYLWSGALLLASPESADDILQPSRGAVVPVDIRTDGAWVWTDAMTYYLEEYGLQPHAGLLAHIRAAGYAAPEVDAATRHRAIELLTGTNGGDSAFGPGLETDAGSH
ncbi:hypothetical protein BX265_6875 [Streptomyces sp. TLI_235]|nr:hypothetical protein [Streptomyces sp. TLI_235]PBC69546.1 hypothetical protein BX265_6875 [Streptomyces sp. TLI_235]